MSLEQARPSSQWRRTKEVAIDDEPDNLLAMLISLVTLITGILAAISEIIGWREHQEEGEQDEAIEQFASEMQEIEERLDGHDVQLDVLEEEVREKLR